VTPVKVICDSGTGVNFISPNLVGICHLNPVQTAIITHQVMSGHTFTSSEWVEVTWLGKYNRPATAWFYVAPKDAPIELLIGSYFIEDNPGIEFMDTMPKSDPALLNVQAKVKEKEKAEIEANGERASAQSAALARDRQQKQQQKRGQQQQPLERKD
jgi:hypothetical protein